MLEIIDIEYDSKEWHEYRSTGIGGSDAAAILGYDPYKSNVQLYEEKANGKVINVKQNERMRYGKLAEEHLIHLFMLDNPDLEVIKVKDKVYRQGCRFASLDSLLMRKSNSELGILEVKTVYADSAKVFKEWQDRIPMKHYIQVLHYFSVRDDVKFAIVLVQIKYKDKNGNPIKITKTMDFRREEKEDDIKYLIAKEDEFWQMVTERKRPNAIIRFDE